MTPNEAAEAALKKLLREFEAEGQVTFGGERPAHAEVRDSHPTIAGRFSDGIAAFARLLLSCPDAPESEKSVVREFVNRHCATAP